MAAKKIARALIVEPRKSPRVEEIGTELESLQKIVGGFIECVYPFEEEVCLICNEEGKILGMELNRALKDDETGEMYDAVAGTFIIIGCKGENFNSLTDDQIKRYTEKYKNPEIFVRLNGEIHAVPVEPEDD